jgi:biopolymer transport protein ExbD
MRFTSPAAASRLTVLPFLSLAIVPAVLVPALVCTSLNSAEETLRLPASVVRPSAMRASPVITVRISREGAAAIAGQPVATGGEAAAWQRETAAVRLLGFEPSQATVVLHADPDVPTAMVQRLIGEAQRAGFQQCVLRGGSDP